jgi:hypothetical protein
MSRGIKGTALGCLVLALVCLSGACGKKGPPLAPIVRVPARILDLSARRLGDTVHVRFTVPDANQDGTRPADLDRVDVYAYTAALPGDSPTLRNATLIGVVKVNETASRETPPADAPPPSRPAGGVDQGTSVTVTETLGPGSSTLVAPESKTVTPTLAPAVTPPLLAPGGERPLTRFYVAVPISRRGRKGAPSGRIPAALVAPPPAPDPPTLAYDETSIAVTWASPVGGPRPPQRADEPGELTSSMKGVGLRTNPSYNVYEIKRDAPADTTATATPPIVTPLNEKPLQANRFDDSRIAFGQERCYAIRLVDTIADLSIEGDASPAACVTPVDTFAPPAPTQLAAIARDGAVDLIWQAVSAPDLAGYLVLRGRAGDATLQPLTTTPVTAAQYSDTSAQGGVRYAYQVVAVDKADPPNRSVPSERVEEAAR